MFTPSSLRVFTPCPKPPTGRRLQQILPNLVTISGSLYCVGPHMKGVPEFKTRLRFCCFVDVVGLQGVTVAVPILTQPQPFFGRSEAWCPFIKCGGVPWFSGARGPHPNCKVGLNEMAKPDVHRTVLTPSRLQNIPVIRRVPFMDGTLNQENWVWPDNQTLGH